MSSKPFEATSFRDYRSLIRAWLAADRGRSLRLLAAAASTRPALVSMVLNGHRDLDPS